MFHVLEHTVLDVLKLVPFVFVSFLFLEFFEHKMSKKTQTVIKKAGKFGPAVGGLFGAVPQCGFSAMASSMYSTKLITLGSLFAVYLSTSDEMLIIALSKNDATAIKKGLLIVLIKVLIGVVVGFIIDLCFVKKQKHEHEHIHEFCQSEHCECEHGIVRSAVRHTIKITLFILIVTLLLNFAIEYLGEENLSKILLKDSVFAPILAAIVGFIPNCASSVVITEMYLANTISFGSCISGLLTATGMGLVILFRVNKKLKENIYITLLLFFIAVACGMLTDLFSITI